MEKRFGIISLIAICALGILMGVLWTGSFINGHSDAERDGYRLIALSLCDLANRQSELISYDHNITIQKVDCDAIRNINNGK